MIESDPFGVFGPDGDTAMASASSDYAGELALRRQRYQDALDRLTGEG